MFIQTAPLPDATALSGVSAGRRAGSFPGVRIMFVPVMWTVWGALVVIAAALYVYRSRLTRDEEDQIFLDDSFDQEKAAQAEIVGRVNKVEPVLHFMLWVVAAASLFVIGYYVLDIIHQFK